MSGTGGSTGVAVAPPDLDRRYGRTRWSRRRTLALGISAAVAVIAVFAAWVVWGGFDGTSKDLEVRDTGYVISSDDSVTVRFELTVDPGLETECAVQALSEQFEIIGWKLVSIPASTERTRGFVETVRATSTPNTGLIYRCWLP